MNTIVYIIIPIVLCVIVATMIFFYTEWIAKQKISEARKDLYKRLVAEGFCKRYEVCKGRKCKECGKKITVKRYAYISAEGLGYDSAELVGMILPTWVRYYCKECFHKLYGPEGRERKKIDEELKR